MHSNQPWSWLWRGSATAKHKLAAETKLVEISKFPSHQETWLSDEALANILTHQFHMTGNNAVTHGMLNCAVSQGRAMLASAGGCNSAKKAACQHKRHVTNDNGDTKNTQFHCFLASPANTPPKSLKQSDLAWQLAHNNNRFRFSKRQRPAESSQAEEDPRHAAVMSPAPADNITELLEQQECHQSFQATKGREGQV
jgi:hypothetical protein